MKKIILILMMIAIPFFITACKKEKNEFTISINSIDGTVMVNDVEANKLVTATSGKLYSFKAVANSNYQFSHWTIDSQEVSKEANYSFLMPSKNIALEAVFTPVNYTITLQGEAAQYKNISSLVIGANSVAYDTLVTLEANDPENEFAGWNVDGSIASSAKTYSFRVSSDTTIYPVFIEESKTTILEAVKTNIGETVKITGLVIAVNNVSFMIRDETASILIYLGKAHSIEVGSIVEVEGTISSYGNSTQIASSPEPKITVKSTGNEVNTTFKYMSYYLATRYIEASLEERLSGNWIGRPVKITGYYKNDENSIYHNVVVTDGENEAIFTLTSIDPSLLEGIKNGMEVEVKGYLAGYTGSSFIQIIVDDVAVVSKEVITIADALVAQESSKITIEGQIVVRGENNLLIVKDDTSSIVVDYELDATAGSIVNITGVIMSIMPGMRALIAEVVEAVGTAPLPNNPASFDNDEASTYVYTYNDAQYYIPDYFFHLKARANMEDSYSVTLINEDGINFVFPYNQGINVANGQEVEVTGYPILYNEQMGGYVCVYTQINISALKNTVLDVSYGQPGDEATFEATVIAITERSILVEDQYASCLIYLGESHNYLVGDVVNVTGTISNYGGVNQITNNPAPTIIVKDVAQVETKKPIPYGYMNFLSYLGVNEELRNTEWVGVYVEVEGTYSSTINTTTGAKYHNVSVNYLDQYFVSLTYPLSDIVSDVTDGMKVKVTGYLAGVTNGQYIQLITTGLEKMETPVYDEITIFSMNDLHGALDASGNNASISQIAQYLIDNSNDLSLIIGAGDMFQGTAVSSMTRGKILIEIMNIIGFDAMSVGNHEFDWGIDEVLKYFNKVDDTQANFPLLVSNVEDTTTGKLASWATPYTVIQKGQYKIGIIGVIGSDQTSDILASHVKNYRFTDELTAINKYTKILRTEEQCDFVILSCHFDSSSINDTLVNQTGDLKIDAILNGHTHQAYYGEYRRSDGTYVPYVQSGSYGRYIGKITLSIDPTTKSIADVNANYIYTLSNCQYENQEVNDLFAKYQQYFNVANELLGTSGVLVQQPDGAQWAANTIASSYNADFGVVNSGGIRGLGFPIYVNDLIYYGDIFEIMPFENTVVVVELKGSYLKKIINYSGLYFSNHISTSSIVDDEVYTVATIDYLYEKDNYPFKNAESVNLTGKLFRDVLAEQVKASVAANGKFYLDK